MANVCIPFGVQTVERGFARHGLAHAFLDCLLIVELVELHTLRRDHWFEALAQLPREPLQRCVVRSNRESRLHVNPRNG